MAERVAALICGQNGPIRVLDPACGDGNLLCAINEALPREMRRRVTLVGIENDYASFASLGGQVLREQLDECHRSRRRRPNRLSSWWFIGVIQVVRAE